VSITGPLGLLFLDLIECMR